MSTDAVLSALQNLLGRYGDGLPITELQIKLYQSFKLQLSYKVIESTIFRYPGLFVDSDGKWKLRV
ncbi:MAG TPA: hypothetical protein VGA85_04425 [Dehalococcoidales bacterium]